MDNFLEEDEDEADHGQIRIQKYEQMLSAKAEEFGFINKKKWFKVQCTLFSQKKNHLELIGNMTKYQLVFLKLETTLTKIGLRLKQK